MNVEWKVTVKQILAKLPGPQGERFAEAFKHGTLRLLIYAPLKHDPQRPHEQDEVYVVASGRGAFVRNDERVEFGPGDVMFVPAGVPHRFEDFSDDRMEYSQRALDAVLFRL